MAGERRRDNVMTEGAVDHYIKQYTEAKGWLPGGRTPWISALREEALDALTSTGFPGKKVEEWKYTNIAPLTKRPFALTRNGDQGVEIKGLRPWSFPDLPCHRAVFVNGHFSSNLSHLDNLPAGVEVTTLARILQERPEVVEKVLYRSGYDKSKAFMALNSALMTDGAVIILDDNVSAPPLHLLFVTDSGEERATFIRNIIIGGRGSEGTIIESYAGPEGASYFTSTVTDLVAERNARIEHLKVQQESSHAYHIGALKADQHRDSTFVSHSISLGAALARTDINSALNEEGARCFLNGLYLARDSQHVDHHTRVDHVKPRCRSEELYKGVIGGRARAVFNGKIVVRENAVKTDACQSNRNLLLSKEGHVDTKPEFEIYADDVQCTHGATVGQLEEEALFYLRSRGIDEERARHILVCAFVDDILAHIKPEALRTRIGEFVTARLPGAATNEARDNEKSRQHGNDRA
ncbi:MAG: Fe-S cluster assembly protein SufD [Thermodesulfobacteriota bacterium]